PFFFVIFLALLGSILIVTCFGLVSGSFGWMDGAIAVITVLLVATPLTSAVAGAQAALKFKARITDRSIWMECVWALVKPILEMLFFSALLLAFYSLYNNHSLNLLDLAPRQVLGILLGGTVSITLAFLLALSFSSIWLSIILSIASVGWAQMIFA